MPWFRLDDGAPNHRKAQFLRLKDPHEGMAAWGWWAAAGTYSAKYMSDGFVAESEAPLVASGLPEEHWRRYVDLLVFHKLLDAGKGKNSKGEREDGWYVHDFVVYNRTKESWEIEKEQNKRRAALSRNPLLKQRVKARDGHRCRYCGRPVRWGGKGLTAGTFDHVDPRGETTFENLVVACNECNASKCGGLRPGAKVTAEIIQRVRDELASGAASIVVPLQIRGRRPRAAGRSGSVGSGRVGSGRGAARAPHVQRDTQPPAGPGRSPDEPPPSTPSPPPRSPRPKGRPRFPVAPAEIVSPIVQR